nr:hypothetical protein BaRGS_014611 [Batillaria attramentaria]
MTVLWFKLAARLTLLLSVLQRSAQLVLLKLKNNIDYIKANAMAVDCLGTWALLAGKKVLAFVNLENPDEGESQNGANVMRVARQSKWDVSCVQFNPHASHAQLFVTALWDCTNPRRCDGSINCGAPVRRARYTPFGAGLVTVVVPQLRRGENSLYMWKMTPENQVQPIHTFVGHKDVVLEFQWRKQPEGVRDQQLVTWSRDQSLRIWRIEPNLQRVHEKLIRSRAWRVVLDAGFLRVCPIQPHFLRRICLATGSCPARSHSSSFRIFSGHRMLKMRLRQLCGHDVVDGTDLDLTGTSYNSSESTLKELRDLTISETGVLEEELSITSATTIMAQQPQTLQQEFSLVNKNIPNIIIDERRHGKTPSRQRRSERETDKSTKKQQSVGKVIVYDVETLVSVSKYLAQHYILDLNDVEGTCRHNANAAAAIGRKDLVQVWTMMSIMSSKSLQPNANPDCEVPWAMLPMGRRLLKEM